MGSAAQFSAMKAADKKLPWWYWNHYVLASLRTAVFRLIRDAGVCKDDRVMEFGCGNRPYESLVSGLGASYFGADYPDNDHADLHIKCDGRLDCPDSSFDCVLSIQVLEHVSDPGAYLQETYRVLKSNGNLIITTHGFWEFHPCPSDYWRWTYSGLEKVLLENGYEIERSEGVVGMLAGSVQLMQDSVRRKLPWGIRHLFVWVCQRSMKLFDCLQSSDSLIRNAMIYAVYARKTAKAPGDMNITNI